MILTLKRFRIYACLLGVLGCLIPIVSFWNKPERVAANTDFPAFYNAGRLVNEYSGGQLYDPSLQEELRAKLARGQTRPLYFAYTPFFALLFSPLAKLSYTPAFVVWVCVSLLLFIFGFRFAWLAANLPAEHFFSGLLIAVSFLPVCAWSILSGQVAAFGFFWLALAIYLDRKGLQFTSGLALSLLAFKPPLLLLIVPMLLITSRWRSLYGLLTGGLTLAAISVMIIGFSGVPSYANMLSHFSQQTAMMPNYREVDLFSFFLPLVNSPKVAYGLVTLTVAAVLPFVIRAWKQHPDQVWTQTIVWTLVLNIYVLMYDTALVIISVLLAGQFKSRTFRWVLVALFLVPWIETEAAKSGFRPMTLAIIALGLLSLRFWPAVDGSRLSRVNCVVEAERDV